VCALLATQADECPDNGSTIDMLNRQQLRRILELVRGAALPWERERNPGVAASALAGSGNGWLAVQT